MPACGRILVLVHTLLSFEDEASSLLLSLSLTCNGSQQRSFSYSHGSTLHASTHKANPAPMLRGQTSLASMHCASVPPKGDWLNRLIHSTQMKTVHMYWVVWLVIFYDWAMQSQSISLTWRNPWLPG